MKVNLRAILAMTLSMLCFTVGDAFVKVVGKDLPVTQIMFIRGFVASCLLLVAALTTGALADWRKLLTPLMAWRTVGEIGATVFFFSGLVRMSFSDAAAIGQVAPLAVTAGAALFLAEPVGWRRWTATIVGFLGVLLIIRPGTSAFNPAAILILLAIGSVALRDLVTRRIGATLPILLISAAAAGSVGIAGLVLSPLKSWQPPTAMHLLLLASAATTVIGGYIFTILATRSGDVSVTSPFRYTSAIFGIGIGVFAFGEHVDTPTTRRPLHRHRRRHLYLLARSQTPRRKFNSHTCISATGRIMTSSPAPTFQRQSDPVGGILAMLAAMFCFIFSDVFSKLASEQLPVGQVIALRGAFSVAFAAVPVLFAGDLPLLRTKFDTPWALRVGGEMLAALGFISALAHMPIANVVAITQSIPLAMTAAGALVLDEDVGWRRWTATIIGFLGVLLIVKPGTGEFSWWSLGALLCVAAVTIRDIATRRLDRAIPVSLITLTTAVGVTIAGAGLGLFEGGWSWPSPSAFLQLAGAAAAVSGAYYFTILAVQKAALSTVAPFRYSIIPLSLVAGYLVWNTLPDRLSLLGITIIAATGLYTFLREQQSRRDEASKSQASPA